MKTFFISVLIFMVGVLPSFSQNSTETTIDERLGIYIPIFLEPHCSKFLTDFGSPKNVVTSFARNIGIRYFSTASIPGMEDLKSELYIDPSDIVHNGKVITDHVIYGFLFTEEDQYIAFCANVKFKTEGLANSFFKTMVEKVGGTNKKKDFSGVVTCKMSGEKRSVVLKLDGSTITFVVIDYNMIINRAVKEKTGM
jgi:hypothetical protein